jgi:curved DNA-binding protein CbpA
VIDFYETLGVKSSASFEQILAAYQKKCKRRRPAWHDLDGIDAFKAKQAEIDNAVACLSDPVSREKHDGMLDNFSLATSLKEDFNGTPITWGQRKAVELLLSLRASGVRAPKSVHTLAISRIKLAESNGLKRIKLAFRRIRMRWRITPIITTKRQPLEQK